ncbi:hypothetical protein BLA39750_00866 [Burkholderia lata]|uniref:Uncharacterized protein n=1 Tax=Burkholderia lata (strain ATCC 17760 / DSM 23089 / LMG 22485 / NCIMB 9086 / R18194 / 383) TaxID=482957 RepID=A0A6P2V447_BURL3|nr:hypothetical protein [Burkholderia lata]VWC75867.1 hypothetical protein BLA39750_00866 [Burkholderia lata]
MSAERNQQDATNTYNEVAKMVVSYVVDCGLEDADLNPTNLSFAIEYAYKPLPRFWRDFDLTTIVEAISERFPNWRPAVPDDEQTAEDVLLDLEAIVYCHALDEANAEMMMALPPQTRPKDREAASEWILAELRGRGLGIELIFAQRDGNRCGEAALEVLHCLERAATGREYDRFETKVAQLFRHRSLATQKKAQETQV